MIRLLISTFTRIVLSVALVAAGVFLVLESVDAISDEWRFELAELVDAFAESDWPGWASALTGLGLGTLAVVLVIVRLTIARSGARRLFVVSSEARGQTLLRGRAVRTAVAERLREHPHVVDAAVTLYRRRWQADVGVVDNANLAAVDAEARALLDDGFWSNLGVKPTRIDLRLHLRDRVAPEGQESEAGASPEPETNHEPIGAER